MFPVLTDYCLPERKPGGGVRLMVLTDSDFIILTEPDSDITLSVNHCPSELNPVMPMRIVSEGQSKYIVRRLLLLGNHLRTLYLKTTVPIYSEARTSLFLS